MKFSFTKKQLLSPFCVSIGVFLLLVPFILSLISFLTQNERLRNLQTRVEFFQEKQKKKESFFRKENKLLTQIHNANPHFVEESLSSLPFIEAKKQQKLFYQLQSKQNSELEEEPDLAFERISFQDTELFRESVIKQVAPVQLSAEDLKSLLCALEGHKIAPYSPDENTPQILIKSFCLEKQPHPRTGEKQYAVSLQFIQRAPLSK